MSEKDFLSQFSGKNTVPESFKEEERKPVYKPKKPVNKVLIVILCVLLLVIGVVVYFVFFAPKIEVPNFEGKTKNDVAAWVKQQDIETNGIIFEEDYYFDYDEDVIISQSIEAGKKVKEDVKITFVSSLGPNPDELITTPDLMNMTKSEIQDWISEYKLTKTKVTSAYSDEVEEGNVISFAYSGCEEDTFARSSTLKISVSKGPAPAGSIAVEDLTKKTYDAAKTWADGKKVTITKTEQYSDTVDKGYIISQSIASGKTMKEGETISVVVSKGKAVKITDFADMNKTEISRWCTKNDIVAYITEVYSDETVGYFVSCEPKVGTTIGAGDSIDIVVSLGNPNIDTGLTTEASLKEVVEKLNLSGADLELVHDTDKYDDNVAVGNLIYYETENEVGDHVHYYLSKGKNIYVTGLVCDKNVTKEADIRAALEFLKLTYQVTYTHGTDASNVINTLMDIYYMDGSTKVVDLNGKYIGQDVTINVVICDKAYSGS